MKKISELEGFNEIFNVRPDYWKYQMVTKEEAPEEFEEAKKKAEAIDEICIAICISDDGEEKAIAEKFENGTSSKFLLFNAEVTDKENSEIRGITYNTKIGNMRGWWYTKWICYCSGSIV